MAHTHRHKATIKLPANWRAIVQAAKSERHEVFVSDQEIDAALRWLQHARASHRTVLRPAQKGDSVEIDFDIRENETPVTNGKAEKHRLLIGAGGYLPGFEDALVGMNAGDEKDFSLAVPENYWSGEIAGKTLEARIKMREVSVAVLPELNHEFAQKAGKFKNLTDLKRSVREGLTAEKEAKEKERFRILMLERLDEASAVEFPAELTEREVATMLLELKSSVISMGLPWPTYLAQIKKSEQELAEEFVPAAHKRIRYALLLETIAAKEGIEPSPQEVEEATNKFSLQYAPPESAEKNIDAARLAQYTKGALRNEKVFQFLEQIAQ